MTKGRVRTQTQKDRAKQNRKPNKPRTREMKDRRNELSRTRGGIKKAREVEKDVVEAYAQGGTLDQLNKLYENRQNIEITKKRALYLKEWYWKRKQRKGDMKKTAKKKTSHYADCVCCGYPRAIVGKRGKTTEDLWHEEHHKFFKQHPLEGEAYAKAKVDAEAACPGWVNKLFDVGQF